MAGNIAKKIGKWLLRGVLALVLLVVLAVAAIYVPAVQDALVPKVLEAVNGGGTVHIALERFRLRFPAKVEVGGLEILQQADTMLTVGEARVSAAVLPLLALEVDATELQLKDVYYKQGGPDSLLCLRARIAEAGLDKAVVKLAANDIDAGILSLDGAHISLAIKNDTAAKPAAEPSKVDWKIHIDRIDLNNVDGDMAMEASLAKLLASVGNLKVEHTDIDLRDSRIDIASVNVTGVDVTALTDPEFVAPVTPEDSVTSAPWTINVATFHLGQAQALYAAEGARPKPGLDMEYLQLSRINIDVDSFAMRGADLYVPIKSLQAVDRSGLQVDANGVFAMDSTALTVKDFHIATLASEFTVDALYGLGTPADKQPLSACVTGEVDPVDLRMALPDMADLLNSLPQGRRIDLDVDISGTLADLRITQVGASMRNYWGISASGYVANATDLNNITGNVKLSGNFADVNFLRRQFMKGTARTAAKMPPLKLRGNVAMKRGVIDGKVDVTTTGGDIALTANWNNRRTDYDIDLTADRFPVDAFLPGMGVGRVTASVKATGHGLDPFSPKTRLTALADAIDVEYNGNRISDLTLKALVADGRADVDILSGCPVANLRAGARGNLAGDTYDWTLDGNIVYLDLHALGFVDSVCNAMARFDGAVTVSPKQKKLDARLDFNDFDVVFGQQKFAGSDLDFALAATDTTTKADVTNHDLLLRIDAPVGLDTIMARLDTAMRALDRQLAGRRANIEELQHALPPFTLAFRAGQNNALAGFLADSDIYVQNIALEASNDSLINITAEADKIVSGTTRIDRVDFNAFQRNEYLRYKLTVDNEPGTLDQFAHIQANGYLAEDRFSIFMRQQNIEGQTGYDLGAMILMTDSTFTAKFIPYKPTIAYKQWQINNDNYVIVNTRHPNISANLVAENNESSLTLQTRTDSIAGDRLYLDIDKVKIQDWLMLSPYAPPMKGDLSANVNIGQRDGKLNGVGTVTLADFIYNKRRVGTFDLDLDLSTTRTGAVYAEAGMKVDGTEVMSATGSLNDSTALYPFLLDLNIDRFPLKVANPFISELGSLAGYLEGSMDVTGSLTEPKLDGYLRFDSASVAVGMLGSAFRFSDTKIPVDSNVVRFDNYGIYGANSNPLLINGTVDMRRLTDVAIDLGLRADNMQLVDGRKKRGSDVYGKAFVSVDATARGNLRFIMVNADVSLNSGTNVTYIIPDATSALASRSTSDMVKFVNFADTIEAARADSLAPPPTAVMINAMLTMQQGSVVGIDLAANGNNRVQIQPSGTIDYSMSPMGDSRFTGRINIDGGYARYTPPLMSEKLFKFEGNSYISFNGDMLNPTVNVTAVDRILASVNQDGQGSRLVNFDVTLKATGTLDRLDVAFDLSTDEDMTVENELQSMSPDQRANQAMNMLLYNVYTGPNTRANANFGGNALYSFLESTVNSWMANNVKGVDISFGIDQYESNHEGNSSTATSYSYKVSKSFLNDRIKIVVGGNYSTDADADENLSQNLINDISVEYFLNNTGTMYVRLFRHTGYESILEGEVTQTGVGFVFKRKLARLRDIFNLRRPRPVLSVPQSPLSAPPQPAPTTPSATPQSVPSDSQPGRNVAPVIPDSATKPEADETPTN